MFIRELSIDFSFAQEFATTFMEANPLFSQDLMRRHMDLKDLLVSPLMVFNLALSIGVQNDSEKAMANLGYYNVQFLTPVYPGDTLSARTKVLKVDDKGPDKPGIVHVRTMCFNQSNDVVLQYERKIMINHSNGKPKGDSKPGNPSSFFQKQISLPLNFLLLCIQKILEKLPGSLPTSNLLNWDKFIFTQMVARLLTSIMLDLPWGNTHPLHYDQLYSKSLTGAMSGEPIVYGLVFAWLIGMASRDISENMLWILVGTEGYHTNHLLVGDTVTAISRILSVEDVGDKYGLPAGEVHLQFIGLKM